MHKQTAAYVLGHISVKNSDQWAQYCSRVPATLAPWGAELVFRGTKVTVFSGQQPHTDTVLVRFPDIASVNGWFSSDGYQALIPLREQAADVVLISYQTEEPGVG